MAVVQIDYHGFNDTVFNLQGAVTTGDVGGLLIFFIVVSFILDTKCHGDENAVDKIICQSHQMRINSVEYSTYTTIEFHCVSLTVLARSKRTEHP